MPRQHATRQAELFTDPLEPRILPHGGWPFWTLNTLDKGRMCVFRRCRPGIPTLIRASF